MKLIAPQRTKHPVVHVAKQNRYGHWNPWCNKVYVYEPVLFDGPHSWVNCQECLWREGLRDKPNRRWSRPVPSNRPRRR